MKKAFILIAAGIIGLSSYGQKNYHGVSGNMVAGDFDNDGLKDDIAAFNTAGELPTLNLWTAHNEFIDEHEAKCRLPFDFLEAKSLNSKIVSGDFDNDGFHDDIAAIYEIGLNKTSLTVWTNNDGEFTPKQWWYGGDFDANQVAQTIVSGDFDRDGFVDDIAAFYDYEQKRTKVFVWRSDSKEFAWPGTWWIGNDFNSTRIQGTMVSGDFNHDGFHDDIAALYDYIDDFTKIFVWTPKGNKFAWPYTWFKQENFAASKAKNNIIAGDFNNNGYIDNIAAMHQTTEYSTSILVFERNKQGFNAPEIWWYGETEADVNRTRLVAIDMNANKKADQITGLSIINDQATLNTWTAKNRAFNLPFSTWNEITLSKEDCEKNGGCLPTTLAGEFNLYPNPNNGQFTIDVPQCSDRSLNIDVFNILGEHVTSLQSQPGVALPIQLENFKEGTYLIRINGKDFSMNQNFVVE